jgi:hypothetical protein
MLVGMNKLIELYQTKTFRIIFSLFTILFLISAYAVVYKGFATEEILTAWIVGIVAIGTLFGVGTWIENGK